MGNIKKITIAVALENEKHLQLLMSKIKFIENSRLATGGMMSAPCLLIEFQGDEDLYHEKGYILKKPQNGGISNSCFTIKNPDGISLDDFIRFNKSLDEFEYNELV